MDFINYICEIKQQLIPIGHPNRKGTKMKPIAIVIHYTANDSPTATDTANVNYVGRPYKLINGNFYESDGRTLFRYGSAQWFIDEDSATLCIPTNEVAWGCGDRNYSRNNGYDGYTKLGYELFHSQQNYKTINYELCNNGDWDKTCNNAIPIIVNDMIKYNIKPNMIWRHGDITGKACPLPFMEDSNAWEDFKNKITTNLCKKGDENLTPEQAIQILYNKGVLSDINYWLTATKVVKNLDILFIKFAQKLN